MILTRFCITSWVAVIFGLAAYTLFGHGYVSDLTLRQIADHMVRGLPNGSHFTASLPYDIPDVIYEGVAPLLGELHGIVPTALSLVAGSLLVGLVAAPRAGRPSPVWTGLVALTIALNPIVLWSATAMGGKAVAVLVFGLVCSAVTRVAEKPDIGGFLLLALGSAIFLFTDPTAVVVMLGLIPWIGLTRTTGDASERPVAYLLVVGTPVVMSLLALGYLHWTGLGTFSPFLAPLNAGTGQDFSWDGPLRSTAMADRLERVPYFALAGLAFFPTVFLLTPSLDKPVRRASAVMLLTVLSAPAICAAAMLPFHALDYLPYLLAPLVVLARYTPRRRRLTVLAAQVASLGLGWSLLAVPGSSLTNGWAQALTGRHVLSDAAERDAAAWIVRSSQPIAVDPVTDYRVIALAGTARMLVMPADVVDRRPDLHRDAASVLTVRPHTEPGDVDEINAAMPDIWFTGRPGDRLAFSRGIYRIWSRGAPE